VHFYSVSCSTVHALDYIIRPSLVSNLIALHQVDTSRWSRQQPFQESPHFQKGLPHPNYIMTYRERCPQRRPCASSEPPPIILSSFSHDAQTVSRKRLTVYPFSLKISRFVVSRTTFSQVRQASATWAVQSEELVQVSISSSD